MSNSFPVCMHQAGTLSRQEWREVKSIAAGPPPCVTRMLNFSGPFELEILESALNRLIQRHPALRASFGPSSLVPSAQRMHLLEISARTGLLFPDLYVQSISDNVSVSLESVDVSDSNTTEQATRIADLYQANTVAGFNLTKAPLMRAIVIRRGQSEHLLLLILHHMIADALSAEIACQEIRCLYHQNLEQDESTLAEAGPGFPAYALWQREEHRTRHYARAINYWQQQWSKHGAGRIAQTDLPFALPPPATPSSSFESEYVDFPVEDATALRTFAKHSKVTLNMLFASAYATVLHHYTKKTTIALWTYFANRTEPAFINSIGCYMTSHLIGFDFSQDPTGGQVLTNTRRTISEATGYADLPLGELWRALRFYPRFGDARMVTVSETSTPLCDSDCREPSISVVEEPVPKSGGLRFSTLGMHLHEDLTRLSVSIQYDVDLFAKKGVQNLLRDLVCALGEFVTHPDSAVSTYAMLSHTYPGHSAAFTWQMAEFVVVGSDLIPGGRTSDR